jgi:SAM-dependent methyltransferase
MSGDKIEILSTELLDQYRNIVNFFWNVSHAVHVEPGWHYLLDLSWAAANLGDLAGKRILDAGAGQGLMQWYLIENGAAQVISADRDSREKLPLTMRSRYNVHGLRSTDLGSSWAVVNQNMSWASGAGKVGAFARGLAGMAASAGPKKFAGEVLIYNQDLANMPDVADNSLDAIVSISALEHNTPEGLQKVVAEMVRKLKPGGRLVATLGAARDEDWFHGDSKGWCYTASTLRCLFDLPTETPDNYVDHDRFFEMLKNNAELRDHLASYYFKSADNGMPWGKWDPKYQTVGVLKIKPEIKA